MNETRKPLWKFVFLIADSVAGAGLAAASLIASTKFSGDRRVYTLIALASFALCLIISLIGIVRYQKERKGVISLCVGLQLFVLLLGFTAAKFLNGFSLSAMIVWAIGVITEGAVIAGYRMRQKNDEEISSDNSPDVSVRYEEEESDIVINKPDIPAPPLKEFKPVRKDVLYDGRQNNLIFSFSDVSEKVTDEYCIANDKTRESLGDYDAMKIQTYACTPVSYMFMWAARNNHLSSRLLDCISTEPLLADDADPAAFIREKMNCQVSSRDFADDIQGFLEDYYESGRTVSGDSSRKFENDYYIQIRNPWKVYYCIDFTPEIYKKVEEQIEKAFRNYKITVEWDASGLMDESDFEETRYSNTFEQELGVCKAAGLYNDYIDKCVSEACDMPDSLVKKLSDKLKKFVNTSEMTVKFSGDGRTFINKLHSGRIIIPSPHGGDTAYVLQFDADFLVEDSLCIVIRDREVVNISGSADAKSPWEFENELNYNIIKSLSLTNVKEVDSIGKALRCYSDGSVEQTVIIPEFTGAPVPEENRLFVPQPVYELKTRNDIIAEKMMNDGTADRYECTPVYTGGSFIPSDLNISLYKGSSKVFSSKVSVW
ncbi:hypothetical protein [Ruminococcus sp. HUN007]|uniref:hypothetical protein n=1 Tax=Ruminococcus sp. HUN007 TaxID=1514668 RepID=UPI0005D2CF36|nr:hypothetical protein [Ruminococcus sp. HUN007]